MEEFLDPFNFLHSIREKSGEAGFCIIQPPTTINMSARDKRERFLSTVFENSADHCTGKEFEFRTKLQNVHQLLKRYDGPAERFITELYAFLSKNNMEVGSKTPQICDHVVDLHKLYSLVVARGGSKNMKTAKDWSLVEENMRICPFLNANIPQQLKSIFRKYLEAFEKWDLLQQSKGHLPILEKVLLEKFKKPNSSYKKEQETRGRNKSSERASRFRDVVVSTEQKADTTRTLLAPEFGYATGKVYNFNEFEEYANAFKCGFFRDYLPGSGVSLAEDDDEGKLVEATADMIEEAYWDLVADGSEYVQTMYGSDVCTRSVKTSGFKQNIIGVAPEKEVGVSPGWNQHLLPRISGSIMGHVPQSIPGITSPFMYIGMLFSSFCWHTEDNYLYSINYLHMGAPKRWYVVPGDQATKFEEAFNEIAPEIKKRNPDVLHQLVTQIPPHLLKEKGVEVYTGLQQAGQIVITWPRAYHAGFSHGFNAAESVNLAKADWLSWCKMASDAYRAERPPHQPVIPLEEYLLQLSEEYKTERSVMECVVPELQILMQEEEEERERVREEGLTDFRPMKLRKGKINRGFPTNCKICLYDFHLSFVVCENCNESPLQGACLQHAEDLCKCSMKKKVLYYRFTNEEFKKVVEGCEDSLAACKKVPERTGPIKWHPVSSRLFARKRAGSGRNRFSHI